MRYIPIMICIIMTRTTIDFLQGTLPALVLKALSFGPLHGYAIARWVEHVTDDALPIEDGALYPTLHRLEAQGLVEATWAVSAETGRRVKRYALTAAGHRRLKAERSEWQKFSGAVTRVLGARSGRRS
jgi:PadR family transcriptional regulator PadR